MDVLINAALHVQFHVSLTKKLGFESKILNENTDQLSKKDYEEIKQLTIGKKNYL